MRKYPRTSRALAALSLAAVCAVVAAPAQSDAAAPHLAAAAGPPTTVVNPRQGDATYANYTFRDGETLAQLRLHYALLGTPHENQYGVVDNAILLLHWTAASSQDLLTPEYQSALFAAGAPFDTTRYFVIIPDDIGHGQSSKPSDGLRASFPHYGYQDMVDLQHRLVTQTLGISHLRAVVGMSMGCMNAWQWAEAYPDAMDGIMPVACFPAPISGRNLLWRRVIIDGITSDPAYDGGNYQQQPPSIALGVNLVQMMMDGVPHLQDLITSPEVADHYVQAVTAQAAAYDANDVIYAFSASADFNAEPDLGQIKAKVFALNFADDEFYRDSLGVLERDMPKVQHGKLVVRATSAGSAGHISMEHPDLWKSQAGDFVNWLNASM
ncbi:alpha/beta fold hydrolase [Kutzneria sp. CA-103260]|uniref:alpha/beta fold hydrolase n=1 Tax=Kutzneria sp. CA-103260 TaxID=2802641 RepID=UPI001BA85ECB|nr:alpha/beta fold hydrolase [Kutzneria sp. CA-103260]QUQ65593.1 Homoserine O-acetyltransferase [Kutzneria sp. CA-103260]